MAGKKTAQGKPQQPKPVVRKKPGPAVRKQVDTKPRATGAGEKAALVKPVPPQSTQPLRPVRAQPPQAQPGPVPDSHFPEIQAGNPGRRTWLFKTAIIIGPSLLALLLFLAFPEIRAALFGNEERPGHPQPTNLLPTPHDRTYLSPTLLLSNQIVAYYGHPLARWMGIVGRFSKEQLGPMIKRTAATYDRLNGTKGTVPAFYLIYGTAQPGGNILTMDKSLVEPYIRYTATNGMLLILDHQIGRFGPKQALDKLLPFLKYPHVHLAMDPEWRTTRPMQEIGWISGEELNAAQEQMRRYMLTNRIPGRRMLIVHQFEDRMIVRRERARLSGDPVMLVHSISGWGSPSMKLGTWGRHMKATNLPHKAFKLWYYPGLNRPGLHFDSPLMQPGQVLALRPEPVLVIYQ